MKDTVDTNEEELNEQDEPLEGSEQFESEEDAKRRRMIQYGVIAAVLVIALAGGWVLYRYWQDSSQKEASLKLSRIIGAYEQGQYQVALNGAEGASVRGDKISGLSVIAREYSGIETGKLAALYAGNCAMAMGQLGEAERYYDQATGSDSPITKMGALAGIASCKAQSNNSAEAAKFYEKAAEMGEKLGDDMNYRFYAAMHYEKAGQREDALRIYRALASSNDFSDIVVQAKSALARLGESVQ